MTVQALAVGRRIRWMRDGWMAIQAEGYRWIGGSFLLWWTLTAEFPLEGEPTKIKRVSWWHLSTKEDAHRHAQAENLIHLPKSGASLLAQWLRISLPMQETQIRSLGQEDPLEKEMATHSSILAWWATVHGVAKGLDTAKRLNQQQQQMEENRNSWWDRVRKDWGRWLVRLRGDLPDGPLGRALCSRCRGTSVIPFWDTKILHAAWYGKKK